MDNEILDKYQQREADLLLLLQYSSWIKVGGFTPGERIMINQERGALFEARSNNELPRFQLEGELLEKVEATIAQIKQMNWSTDYVQKIYLKAQ